MYDSVFVCIHFHFTLIEYIFFVILPLKTVLCFYVKKYEHPICHTGFDWLGIGSKPNAVTSPTTSLGEFTGYSLLLGVQWAATRAHVGGSRADRLRAAEWALSVTGRSVFKCLRVTSLPKCQIRERGRLRLLQSSAFTSNNLQQQWRNLSRSNCAGQVRTVSKQKFVSQRLEPTLKSEFQWIC